MYVTPIGHGVRIKHPRNGYEILLVQNARLTRREMARDLCDVYRITLYCRNHEKAFPELVDFLHAQESACAVDESGHASIDRGGMSPR